MARRCYFVPPDVTVVALVLVSAFLHALWNALLKQEQHKDVAGAAVFALAMLWALAAALLEWTLVGRVPFPNWHGAAYATGSGFVEGIYLIALVRALERAPLGIAYTVSRGGALLLVWPISLAFLGEDVSALAIVGTLTLCLGLAITSLSRQSTPPDAAGLLWAGLAALCIAIYNILYKLGLATGASPNWIFATSIAVAVSLNLLRLPPARRRSVLPFITHKPWHCLIRGLVCTSSFLVLLVALREGGVGFVTTLRNSSIVFALALGWTMGQPIERTHVIGAVVVIVGALLLGAG